MRRFLLVCALAFACTPVFAAPPTDAQLDELMRVMRVREQLEGARPQMDASVRQSAEAGLARRGRTLSPGERREFDAVITRSISVMHDTLAWDAVQPVLRDVYRDAFEADDVAVVVDFYRTPAGQRLLDRMPKLMNETMVAVQRLLVPMFDRLDRELASGRAGDGPIEDAGGAPAISVPVPPLP